LNRCRGRVAFTRRPTASWQICSKSVNSMEFC
jgi:hypothetical protein